MMVEELSLYLISMKLIRPFVTSFGKTLERPCILVRVKSNGEEGWGEVVAESGPWYSYETTYTAWYIITEFVVPFILGKEVNDPRDINKLLSPIRGHNMAKAGVEMAIWDLYARLQGKPLFEVLGGVRKEIESGVSIGIQKSVKELLNLIDNYLAQGYKRIKVKIKPGWDVDIIRTIRKEYPDIPLQVDANAAYTIRDVNMLRELDKYSLLMIEQPFSYDDLVDHATLQRMLKTPICLDESISSPSMARSALALGSCKVINIKPGRVGGHLSSLTIHDICLNKGVPCWIGGMLETGVGRAHNVALATLPNIKYPNDISGSDRYYEKDIVEPPFKVSKHGTISVPKGIGIGVEVLIDDINRLSMKQANFKM